MNHTPTAPMTREPPPKRMSLARAMWSVPTGRLLDDPVAFVASGLVAGLLGAAALVGLVVAVMRAPLLTLGAAVSIGSVLFVWRWVRAANKLREEQP